jgi:hypothetical protein
MLRIFGANYLQELEFFLEARNPALLILLKSKKAQELDSNDPCL